MSPSEEVLEPIAAHDQVALVTYDEIVLLELNKEFGYPWSRSAHQGSECMWFIR